MLVKKRIGLRIEETRLEKLHKLADLRKKTMTQIIEELLDNVVIDDEK